MENQDWLSSNLEGHFPFRETCLSGNDPIPQGLFVDMRVCLPGITEMDVYISSLQYDQPSDTYILSFATLSNSTVILTGSISRTNNGSSRVFLKQQITLGPKVGLFTPGPLWDTPSWNGAGSWVKNWASQNSLVENSLVNPGAQTFGRIFIDDGTPIPPESEWPKNSIQILMGGYNIAFTQGQNPTPSLSLPGITTDDIYEISCIPGAGAGYAPSSNSVINLGFIATINGVGPSGNGNISLTAEDCLWTTQPTLDNQLIPATLQLLSNCQPCCPCSQYRNISEAISRRSAKIIDACNFLAKQMADAQTAYNDGVATINKNRPSIVRVRNVRALGSQLIFSIQNISAIPVYAYVSLTYTGNYGQLQIADGQKNVVFVNSINTLTQIPDMVFSTAETGQESPPAIFNLTANYLLQIGQTTMNNVMDAIQPGATFDVVLNFPQIQTILTELIARNAPLQEIINASLGGNQPRFNFQSISCYGASKCFGCAMDTYDVQIQNNLVPLDPLNNLCGVNSNTLFIGVPVK